MKMLKLRKADLARFAEVLPAFGELYAPVRRGKGYAFERPARWSDVVLDYPRTMLPPRKLFLPPRETMFLFDPKAGYSDTLAEASTPRVLFGVHSYDIEGLNVLDHVFALGPFPDPYYVARRRATAIIGLDFWPDDRHFAASMRAEFADRGFDLFLSSLEHEYLVFIGTSRGHDMVMAAESLFDEPATADVDEFKRRSNARLTAFTCQVPLTDLAGILDLEYDSEVWDALAERCLSCGACSMVCPTCYCFDLRDEVDFGARAGRRLRVWDSCLFKAHAAIAGGENFRATRAARIKFRFYHKQRGFVAEYGRPSCVGCGRCEVACPAGIDIATVVAMIRGHSNGDVARQREPAAGA